MLELGGTASPLSLKLFLSVNFITATRQVARETTVPIYVTLDFLGSLPWRLHLSGGKVLMEGTGFYIQMKVS